MIHVCFSSDKNGTNRDFWEYLITGFNLKAYDRAPPEPVVELPHTTIINSIDDLPTDIPLIVVQCQHGKQIQGEHCIYDYVHPENAIYYFGSDKEYMNPEDFGDREYDSIYIPQEPGEPNELWSHQVGAMVIYDILRKNASNR